MLLLNTLQKDYSKNQCGYQLKLPLNFETTCLEIFAEAIRAGYREYYVTQGKGEFAKLDLTKRCDRE